MATDFMYQRNSVKDSYTLLLYDHLSSIHYNDSNNTLQMLFVEYLE